MRCLKFWCAQVAAHEVAPVGPIHGVVREPRGCDAGPTHDEDVEVLALRQGLRQRRNTPCFDEYAGGEQEQEIETMRAAQAAAKDSPPTINPA